MQDFNTRIASRSDTKQNWELNNPILLQGEIAIVFDGNNQLFKVGDGQKHFNELQYSFYDQFASEQINTSNLRAKSISQGYGSNINGIGGIATGYKSQVNSNFAQSHGYQANVSSDFGYVWNGDNTLSTYADHGNGSYNINPKNGLSGFYIGDKNLKEIINIEAPTPNLSNYYEKSETSSSIELDEKLSQFATLNSLNDLSNQVNPSESDVTASGEYYRVYADKMNNLTSVSDHMKIVLDGYDFSKSYVMKFNTPQNNEIHFDFYVDNGSGPQFDSEMNINKSYSFPMNSGYVIEVKFDAMDIRPLAWNGDRQKMVFRTVEWVED